MVVFASGIVDERLPGGGGRPQYCSASLRGVGRGTWPARAYGVVLAHCWVLRDHMGLVTRDLLEWPPLLESCRCGGVRVLVGVVFGC